MLPRRTVRFARAGVVRAGLVLAPFRGRPWTRPRTPGRGSGRKPALDSACAALTAASWSALSIGTPSAACGRAGIGMSTRPLPARASAENAFWKKPVRKGISRGGCVMRPAFSVASRTARTS